MSKQAPFAREEVMEAYLDSLLKEPNSVDEATARTARLLERAAQQMTEDALVKEEVITEVIVAEKIVEEPVEAVVETTEAERDASLQPSSQNDVSLNEPDDNTDDTLDNQFEAEEKPANQQLVDKMPLKDTLDNRFQALFFEVAGLTLAVPLTTLGGIHQIDKIGPLFGKPDWFMGVMIHREEKLNVVDSAKWVMPEKYDEFLAESLNYRYLIMLGNSFWGLASEKLINTVTLAKADVKWRESTGKRPWLAGMVKEKMCALIDVDELISMLNKGLGSNDQTP